MENIEKRYRQLLEKIIISAEIDGDKELVAFFPMQGRYYDNKIMIIGRALNGWKVRFKPQDINLSNLSELIQNIRKNGMVDRRFQDQLNWVQDSWGAKNRYNTKKSAFWRVIRRLIHQIYPENQQLWNQRIVWSNIYKVSARKGNPNKKLEKLIKEDSRQILIEELKIFKPEKIIFLTGYQWARKIFNDSELVAKNSNPNTKYVEFIGELNFDNLTFDVIISKHPQGKKEKKLVDEIIGNLKERQ